MRYVDRDGKGGLRWQRVRTSLGLGEEEDSEVFFDLKRVKAKSSMGHY